MHEPTSPAAPESADALFDAVYARLKAMAARQLGARRTLALPVSAPFHCPLMEPAADRLAPALARVRFADPKPAVVTNVEATPNADGARARELLSAQVTAPVRFTEMVEALAGLEALVREGIQAAHAPGLDTMQEWAERAATLVAPDLLPAGVE